MKKSKLKQAAEKSFTKDESFQIHEKDIEQKPPKMPTAKAVKPRKEYIADFDPVIDLKQMKSHEVKSKMVGII